MTESKSVLRGKRFFFILFSYNNNDNDSDNDNDDDNLLKSNLLIPYDSQGTPPLEPCAARRILCRFFEVERLDLRSQSCGSIKDEEICSQMTISANDWNN